MGFLDFTGLGALVGSLKRLREKDGSLTLVTSSGRILQTFRLTALERVFTLYPSIQQAIRDDQHWQAALATEGLTQSDGAASTNYREPLLTIYRAVKPHHHSHPDLRPRACANCQGHQREYFDVPSLMAQMGLAAGAPA